MEPFALFSLFLIALTYGATACMLSCVPLLSPILLANGVKKQETLRLLIPITAGRITGYTFLSFLAFAGSSMIQTYLHDKILMGHLLGSLTILIAFRQFMALRFPERSCSASSQLSSDSLIALFLSGIVLSMSMCTPVATMLTLSATAPSPAWALLYGLTFGLGATLLWFLFFSVVLAPVLRESLFHLHRYRRVLELLSPLMLAMVGVAIFNGWLQL